MTRISRAEWIVAAAVAAVLAVLVLIEPDILGAPLENGRTLLFTVGGTAIAAVVLVVMLRRRVPPAIRIPVLLVPFLAVNWWLLSPFFIDDVVDEEFATTIAEQRDTSTQTTSPPSDATGEDDDDGAPAPSEPPATPVLLGVGSFVGLAGHDGSGDAGVFRNPDGTQVVRFERFDIENGPDLEVYIVPGADQTSLAAGSLHLGALKGNVGDQTYEIPAGQELGPGPHTVLVWCDAFSVEFVGATVRIS